MPTITGPCESSHGVHGFAMQARLDALEDGVDEDALAVDDDDDEFELDDDVDVEITGAPLTLSVAPSSVTATIGGERTVHAYCCSVLQRNLLMSIAVAL